MPHNRISITPTDELYGRITEHARRVVRDVEYLRYTPTTGERVNWANVPSSEILGDIERMTQQPRYINEPLRRVTGSVLLDTTARDPNWKRNRYEA